MRYAIFLFIVLFFFSACDKSNDPPPNGQWSNSVFIVNEGPFQNGTGTIMAYDRTTGQVSADLFEAANGRPLGNIVQSITVHEGLAYIMVNNAHKIEVVNYSDFKSVATIENITYPRYFIGLDTASALVSCWDNTVKFIDLNSFTVTGMVEVGTGPDEMVKYEDRCFVVNSGGFGLDSTVSVFNINGPSLEIKILVGHHPAGIRLDKDHNLWVLCAGKGWNGFPDPGDTPAKLVCINPVSLEITKEFVFDDNENHPDNLIINKDGSILYYNHPEGIFTFPVNSSSLSAQAFISSAKILYALGYDNKEDLIYATNPLDNNQNGYVYRFQSSDGSAIDTVMAGIVPTGFWFNE
jgi:hypothetical protein